MRLLIKKVMKNILIIVIVAALFNLFGYNKTIKDAETPPNILFVIGDDWSYGHAGIYGDEVIQTPNFDRIAREGALFDNAYCASPSCSPSRAAILTGQYPHRLKQGANLWGFLPLEYSNYTRLLENQGYYVGLTRKGWGPGNPKAGGYEQNPAGKTFADFAAFYSYAPKDKPFCFWFGTSDPHRPYEPGSGTNSGLNPDKLQVPRWLPDVAAVRGDILDYYYEIQRLDKELGEMLKTLEGSGQLDNTIVVVASDNGMPFPRAKANLYDGGTRMPLAIRWKGKIKPGQRIKAFVSLTDLAPTFLTAAGQKVPSEMTGTSLLPLLRGQYTKEDRSAVFLERERHANVRQQDVGYPSRAIRTHDYLYIKNYHPERWPAGDPELYHSVGPYGDVDDSPSKQYILQHRKENLLFYDLAFDKRPAEELYDLKADPHQLNNVAANPKFAQPLKMLRAALQNHQIQTADPRVHSGEVLFDSYPYFGPPMKGAPSTYKPK